MADRRAVMDDDAEATHERLHMVAEQIARRGIVDQRLLDALRQIPRHQFLPPDQRMLAYLDGPLPIGHGQTISQPYIVALMTQLLCLQGNERLLEVGTGSGYQAAILGILSQEVHTIERHAELADQAARVLLDLGIKNVHVHTGDGSLGLPDFAPYQGILVTAAAPSVPDVLLQQLDEGGRLVLPVGGRYNQYLERWERTSKGFSQETLVPVAFVPLRGAYGWQSADDH